MTKNISEPHEPVSRTEYVVNLERKVEELEAALEETEHDMHMRIRASYDKTIADSWKAALAKVEAERDALAEKLKIKEGTIDLMGQFTEKLQAEIDDLQEERTKSDACWRLKIRVDTEGMSEHIQRMQELLDSIAVIVGTPGNDPGDLDGFEVLRLHVKAAMDNKNRATSILNALASEFERAIRHHENKGKGGQQVTFTGDFASVGPSVVQRMRWWLREMRAAGATNEY